MTFDDFKKQFIITRKNGTTRVVAEFRRRFGDLTMEQAYEQEEARQRKVDERIKKIAAFEQYLIKVGAQCQHSNISESRYYHYNDVKYRFSGHFYPTGSMTARDGHIVDLAADPQLIDEINF